MKSLITRNISLLFSLLITTSLWAQPDDFIKQTINARLQEGDCATAEQLYNAWCKTQKSSDRTIEKQIAACKNGKTIVSPEKRNLKDFELTINGVSMKMIFVEGGKISINGKAITIGDYFISETEVTRDLYGAVITNSIPSKDLYPQYMSYMMAISFISKLSSETGYVFSIPNVAEWEYAAKGGKRSNGYKYSGSNLVDEVAWYRTDNDSTVHPVKRKKPNELGAYDMSGNLGEFCSNVNSETIYIKGGNYYWPASYCSLNGYNHEVPLSRKNTIFSNYGLRVVLRISDNQKRFIQNSKTTWIDGSSSGTTGSPQDYTETAFGINMKMVYVEGGTFNMGCTSEQGGECESDESPNRQTTVGSYYIGMLEVTQGQWEKVMGTSISQQRNKENPDGLLRGTGPDYPMYYVSWEEAKEFCARLSRQTGKTYRLPTEAEWEYAARGGKKNEGTKYSGGWSIDDVAWYDGNSGNSTHMCGTKRPNALDLYDMSGNVWEWCEDWYGNQYLQYDNNNPKGASTGTMRVNRGGGLYSNAKYCRVANRDGIVPGTRYIFLGFRVVCRP